MVKYIISGLSLWYGKTTWWRILGRVFTISRKIFIIFNAIIGIYVVYKLSGFQVGLALSHFGMMGHTYLELLYGFTKRIFEWFLDFLGYDIGPSKPGGNNNTNHLRKLWNIGEIPKMPDYNNYNKGSLREIYKLSSINIDPISTPWYKDLTTWLWIGGIISLVGLSYFGYKVIFDPSYFNSDLTPTNINPPKGKGIAHNTPTIYESIVNGIKNVGNKTITGIKLLNPYSWFTTTPSNDVVEAFNSIQKSDKYDDRYFPFTAYHPYDPWYENLRIRLLGETSYEKAIRLKMKRDILNQYLDMPSPANSLIDLPPISPHIGSIGLGTRFTSSSGLVDQIEATTSAATLSEKLSSLPNTPTNTPGNLPDVEPYEGTYSTNRPIESNMNIPSEGWEKHEVPKGEYHNKDKWKLDTRQFRYSEVTSLRSKK